MDYIELTQHWNYFCSLAERLDETKHYIDHCACQRNGSYQLIHGNVYSDIFKQIILLTASEFEVMSKALCLKKGKDEEGIVSISKTILGCFPKIVDAEVLTSYWVDKPFCEWRVDKNDKVLGIDWWKAYTSIKHGNKGSIKLATLKNAVESLAALYIIDLCLMYVVFGNLSLSFSFPPVYFKSKYTAVPVSSGEGKLPDYGDLSPQELFNLKYPDIFKIE